MMSRSVAQKRHLTGRKKKLSRKKEKIPLEGAEDRARTRLGKVAGPKGPGLRSKTRSEV